LTGPIGAEGDVRWGFGKLDVYAAMQEIFFTGIESHAHAEYSVIPNPAHDRIYVTGDLQGTESFKLVALDGTIHSAGQLNGSVEIASLPNGMYILMIESGKGVASYKVMVEH